MVRGRLAAFFLILLLVLPSVPALGWAPQRGSPERTALMDALRPSIERELGMPVLFKVEAINVEGAWAFVSATPLMANGQPMDWSRTKFARAKAGDMMSDVILALFRGEGGSWRLVEYALGPTDVAWEEWIGKHKVPRRVFEGAYDQQGSAPPGGAPAPTPQGSGGASQPPPDVAAKPGWRQWTFGDVSLSTPERWQSLDSMTSDLVLGGEPWTVTFSDRPMSTGQGTMLVLAWKNDEYIYSRSLNDRQILGSGRQEFAGLVGNRTFFRIKDRYNDAQGWDVVTSRPVKGGRFVIGCRAPAAQWPRVQDTCEEVLGSLSFASLDAAPAPTSSEPSPSAPTASGPAPSASAAAPAPQEDAKGKAFTAMTRALERLEAYEKSKDHADWQAGLEAAQEAVELQPETADYWRVLGYAYSLGGTEIQLASALAEEAYEKSIAIDPRNTGSRMLLAALLLERKSYSRALDNIEAAVTIKPDLAASAVVVDMCRVYIIDEQTKRGAAFLNTFVSLNPRSHAARLGLALMLKEQNRTAEAIQHATRVANDPQAPQPDAEHAKALLKEWQGK